MQARHTHPHRAPAASFRVVCPAAWRSRVRRRYTNIVWLTIFFHAFGGLTVAAVVKYANSILKGFAAGAAHRRSQALGPVRGTSSVLCYAGISIVTACILSIYIFDFVASGQASDIAGRGCLAWGAMCADVRSSCSARRWSSARRTSTPCPGSGRCGARVLPDQTPARRSVSKQLSVRVCRRSKAAKQTRISFPSPLGFGAAAPALISRRAPRRHA